jgi:hypothetical protein
MLEDHKKQCAASAFATVSAGAPSGGSKVGSGGGYNGGWAAKPVGGNCVVALDNAPYLTVEGSPSKDLVHVSDQPLLTGDECDAIVKSAEKRAAEHGWGSRCTYQTPTTRLDPSKQQLFERQEAPIKTYELQSIGRFWYRKKRVFLIRRHTVQTTGRLL